MRCNTRTLVSFLVTAFAWMAVASPAAAVLCGDTSGDGFLASSDALRTLRLAVSSGYDRRGDVFPRDSGPGGAGDGLVTISIAPHPFYKRDGNDIRLDLPVTLKEAVLGGKVKVPTPEGPVMVTIPKGSSSGKVLRLKGRGFTGKNGKRLDASMRASQLSPPP